MDSLFLLAAIVSGIGFFVAGVTGLIQAAASYPGVQPQHRKWLHIAIIAFLVLSVVFVAATYITSKPSNATNVNSCPSLASGDAASSLIPCSSPVVDDPMNDRTNKNGWGIKSQSSGSCGYVTGAYHLIAPARQGIGCWSSNQNLVFSNFVYQVKMTIVKGVNNNQSGTGPMFRISPDHGSYQVSFNAAGARCLWVFKSPPDKTKSLDCKPGTPSFRTGIGQSNYITVKAQDQHFDIQINGHNLYSFTDSSYVGGYIGFQLGPGTQDSDVIFSDVKVWQV